MDPKSALRLALYIVVVVLCFALIWWLIDYMGLPHPFGYFLRIVFAVLAVAVVIGFLLRLAGGKPPVD